MKDTSMRAGLKSDEIIALSISLLASSKSFSMQGSDWQRGAATAWVHLYRFCDAVIKRLVPLVMGMPKGQDAAASAAEF